ncbi:RNA methyltransferase [Quisquiliibacterium transsilvanicum]
MRVVLVRPGHPGNVGSSARAMRVMGLRDLALVDPREPDCTRHPEAIAFASGATDVLEAARVFGSLDEALADASLVVGVSAGPREFGPPPQLPEEAMADVLDELAANPAHRVALVFGTERTGLSITEVSRCQRLCSIPGDPDYCSLNLSQAVQLVAYVLRRAAIAAAGEQPASGDAAAGRLASQGEVEGFFAHFERALVAIGYLDPAHPKKLMPRMRRLFGRARLETEEVQLLRGVCKLTEDAGRAWTARPGARPADDGRVGGDAAPGR